MTCYHPVNLYPTESGKRSKKCPPGHDPKAYLPTPCGTCIGCRIRQASDAGIRGAHELRYHQHARFLTITYNPESLPEDGELCEKHMQKFIRDLRYASGERLRVFYCGEYGGKTGRAHYHAIVYGLKLEDEYPETKNQQGQVLYRSEEIERIWDKGTIYIGEVNETTCAYVGAYMLKDISGSYDKKEPYKLPLPHEEVIREVRPYVRYPGGKNSGGGLGRRWIEEYVEDVFPNGIVHVQRGLQAAVVNAMAGGIPKVVAANKSRRMVAIPAPRFYAKVCEQIAPDLYEEFVQKRLELATSEKYKAENTPERLAVRKEVFKARLKGKGRGTAKHEDKPTVVLP